MNLLSLFSQRLGPKNKGEIAPQLTLAERQIQAQPGVPPGPLPYAIYDQMERDAMIQTALTIKSLAVVAADAEIVPKDGSPKARMAAKFIEDCFQQMEGSPVTILRQAMSAFSRGWSIQEMVYEYRDGQVWLRAVRPKDPSLFGVELDAYGAPVGLELLVAGEPKRSLPLAKFAIYANRRTLRQTKGRSDLDAAHRHWLAKQSLLNAWRVHLERYASPTVLGRYQRGLPGEEQQAVLRALQGLSDNTAIVFPNEIDISTLGGDASASAGFMEAIEFHNREIARSILGQTLTTDEGRRVGSLALGKVHLQVLLLQVESIRRELADLVLTEQVIRPLVDMNFGPGVCPRFQFVPTKQSAFISGTV